LRTDKTRYQQWQQRLRIDNEPRLPLRPKDVPRVHIGRQQLGPCAIVLQGYFTTRSQRNVLSTTGGLSSEESTRNDIRSIPWKVYHRVVALPTALGV